MFDKQYKQIGKCLIELTKSLIKENNKHYRVKTVVEFDSFSPDINNICREEIQ